MDVKFDLPTRLLMSCQEHAERLGLWGFGLMRERAETAKSTHTFLKQED